MTSSYAGVSAAEDAPAPQTASPSQSQSQMVAKATEEDKVPDPPTEVHPPESAERAKTAVPLPAEDPDPAKPPDAGARFDADPVADGAIIAFSGGFAGLLDLINSTGEVRPQQISSNFDRSKLLGIDRGAIDQDADQSSRTTSNIGLFAAIGFAAIDPILSGWREKSVQSGVVDAIMYGESITITWGVTNLAKMAVRRPRPAAYIEAEKHRGDPNYSNSDTDSALSFFSGHASMVAAISSTATYLAFARSPGTARPWITLLVGTALTSAVSIERVRAAAHFPTDVIAGAIAGAGVGVIVPHLHRSESLKQRAVWVGFAPAEAGARGGALQVGGNW